MPPSFMHSAVVHFVIKMNGAMMQLMKKLCALTVLLMFFGVFAAYAEDAGFPRAGSLKRTVTNVRAGPGTQYPILWIFNRKDWPVQLIARYQSWYKIRDMEGEEGWIYASLVSQVHTTVVSSGEPVTMYRKADGSEPILRLGENVVLHLKRCGAAMCEISYRNYTGWVAKNRLEMTE